MSMVVLMDSHTMYIIIAREAQTEWVPVYLLVKPRMSGLMQFDGVP